MSLGNLWTKDVIYIYIYRFVSVTSSAKSLRTPLAVETCNFEPSLIMNQQEERTGDRNEARGGEYSTQEA
jgi:hypothetical protein